MPPIQIPARVTRVKQFTRFTQFPLSCSSRGDMVVPHDSCEGRGRDVLQPVIEGEQVRGNPVNRVNHVNHVNPVNRVNHVNHVNHVTRSMQSFFHRFSLFDAFRPMPR
jgi:hypothetical protein